MHAFPGLDLLSRNQDAADMFDADRRSFLRCGLGAGLAAALGMTTLPGLALAGKPLAGQVLNGREIRLNNAHTGDMFAGAYWENGRYLPDAFARIRQVMRDHRTGDTFPIDPRLMDILFVMRKRLDKQDPFRVFSGYRSPRSNAMLRRQSEGVAQNSLHMTGQAIDLAMPGVALSRVQKVALTIKSGGVGYYPRSGFVHVDTGRVRSW